MPFVYAGIGLVIGFALFGLFSALRKKSDKQKLVSAQAEAKRILSEAVQSAAATKKEALLETKEEILVMKTEAENELKVAKQMLTLMNQNAAIGYEAANHYYFSKGQIAEKIVNCHHIIDVFSKK